MNIFYAPPSQIRGDVIELQGQEATHASKALRYRKGDEITVVDGLGGWYEGQVQLIADSSVRILVQETFTRKQLQPDVTLGMGIIKKRDRLEFAVEKAVELGVEEIALFQGAHSIKKNVRTDRLESITLSAMKQSLQCWLPSISVYPSLQELVDAYPGRNLLAAHQKGECEVSEISEKKKDTNYLLLIGPEGGLSEQEFDLISNSRGSLVTLGPNRLRTETAALALINQFNYWRSSLNRG